MESTCVTVSTSSHAPLVITHGLSVGGAGKQLKPFQFHLGIVFTAAHAYCLKYSIYLPSMCHVALAPLEWNVLRLNLRAFFPLRHSDQFPSLFPPLCCKVYGYDVLTAVHAICFCSLIIFLPHPSLLKSLFLSFRYLSARYYPFFLDQ